MKYSEEPGNIFELPNNYALGQCMSQDCDMRHGIVEQFNATYPDMQVMLINTIRNNKLKYPFSVLYEDADNNLHKVLNIFTKRYYKNKPTYATLKGGLEEVLKICKDNNIKYLGLPRIGSGLDKLNWEIVRDIIKSVFEGSDIEIAVRYKVS